MSKPCPILKQLTKSLSHAGFNFLEFSGALFLGSLSTHLPVELYKRINEIAGVTTKCFYLKTPEKRIILREEKC